jgi:hypothetical protein
MAFVGCSWTGARTSARYSKELTLRASCTARTKLAVVEDPESEPRVRLYDGGDGALDPAA